ncbi:MAG TPA: hypothetical protein VNZ53_31955 [Steroidobacteraceae bacterium]|jgi:hypothetical protein|nr:hypothetical protein [Steroidobacteraceae bacterium]
MSLLARVLNLGGLREPESDSRQRLRAARLARDRVKAVEVEAVAAVGRIEALIGAAEDATDAAEAAESAVSRATRTWAESGARSEATQVDQTLLDQMDQTRRAAAEAASKSPGARAALPGARRAAADAGNAVTNTVFEIKEAIGEILLTEVAPQFEVLQAARVQYIEALADLKSLHQLLRAWGPAHSWYEFSSPSTASKIASQLRAAEIYQPTDNELRAHSQAWADFAKRLREDPDVQF